MAVSRHRRPLVVFAAVALLVVSTACSSATGSQREAATVGSSGATAAAIGVDTTPSFITIENRAGLPLVDVNVAVQATNGLSFSTSVPRLESGVKRDVSLANLRSPDGTSY